MRLIPCGTTITQRSSARLLLLAVLIQAAIDAAETIKCDEDAEEFLVNPVVRRNYLDVYGIRNLPHMFREKYKDGRCTIRL